MPFEMVGPRDVDGFARARAQGLLRAKERWDAGKGVRHESIEG